MSIFDTADILLPKNVDYCKWSVVACDQYTSEHKYWNEVEEYVGDTKSTLHLILPEVYLDNTKERVEKINAEMKHYLSEHVFDEISDSFILVARKQRNGKTRYGIVGKVDLEEYDFSIGSDSYIRASEKTVQDRIPPRVKIRENASLELPHVIMLIDDDERRIIEPSRDMKDSFDILYDFDLMMDSGHLTGYKLTNTECERIKSELVKMSDQEYFNKKYNVSDKGVLLFAVGDGNHSLATAKTVWDNIKMSLSEEERKNHPARYALVELMNIHDETLEFEPIHRVVFGADEKLVSDFKTYANSLCGEFEAQKIIAVIDDKEEEIVIPHPELKLGVATLQKFLDEYDTPLTIDYIHGKDSTRNLSQNKAVGFILPDITKRSLFETVIYDGVLPRKTFSMGEAHDKRFYVESRKIK